MKAIARLVLILVCIAPLHANVDRLCAPTDFELSASPAKAVFDHAEVVTIRLTLINKTHRDAWIVPHLYPFDYWVEKYTGGRWKEIGGIVPAARTRHNMPLGPRDESEYRKLRSGETYSTTFAVDPEFLGNNRSGRFRVRVRTYAKEVHDENLRDLGCAMLTKELQFSIR